jgi:RND family efflux transporter MFP subunit
MPADVSQLTITRSDRAGLRPRRRRWVLLVLLLLAAAGAGYLLLSSRTATVQVASVTTVYPSRSFTLLNANGYVVADRKAAVGSKTSARLVWLGVEEGSRVKSGEILARLEADDVTAALARAKAARDAARGDLAAARAEQEDAAREAGRMAALDKSGAAARAEYDAAETRRRKAVAGVAAAEGSLRAQEAAVREAETALEYTNIRAPFDGVVLTKSADLGDMITPLGAAAGAKASVVTMADLSTLQVEADVAEANLSVVSSGQPCEISLDSLPGERFPGRVHMIVPTADRSKASVLVKVRFAAPDPRILPEMSAKVAFLSRPVAEDERKPVLAAPAKALLLANGKTRALVLDGDVVKEREVAAGRTLGDLVEILSGLAAGERVVLSPPPGLKPGDKAKAGQE